MGNGAFRLCPGIPRRPRPHLLRQAKPGIRRTELTTFDSPVPSPLKRTGTGLPSACSIRGISGGLGECYGTSPNMLCRTESAISADIYTGPLFKILLHRRRLLLFLLSHSSRSAFSASSAALSSAISRLLLSSYAFACLSSAAVRLPVGFWRSSILL